MNDSDEPRGPDPSDPLSGLSVLSLFPRTMRASEAPASIRSDDLESINGFMKSVVLKSPSKHLQQAKSIFDGNSELLNAEFDSFLASEKINEDIVVTKISENDRERRPGLGRKRARFSLKLDSSHPSVNLESSLDFDHIQDPEEFFLAHEKYENARLELHLMSGGSTPMGDLETKLKLCHSGLGAPLATLGPPLMGSQGPHGGSLSGSVGEKYTKRSRNVDESAVEYNDSRINTDAGVETNGPDEMVEEIALNTKADILENKHSEMEENVGDMLQKVGSSADFNLGGSSSPDAELLPDGQQEMGNTLIQTNVEDTAQDAEQDGNIGQPAAENLDNNQTRLDDSLPSTVVPHAVGVSADASDEFPENVEVGDMLQKVGSSADFNLGGSSRPDAELLPDGQHEMGNTRSQTNVEDTAQDAQQDGNIGQPATENLDNNQTRLDESLPSTVEPHAVGVSADASDEFPENVKALKSPSKHLEQAKFIVDGNSELLNAEFASFLASEKKNEDVVGTKINENARERRPGLGRRRARFSLKLDSSHPSVNLEPSLDFDHIQDPEEFFLAHEKHENARLELHLMRGGSLADFDCDKSKPERRRRPGILGKTYKHRISLTLPEIDDKSSQVTSGQDILSPPHYTSEQETANPNVKLQEKDLIGSVSNTENRGDGLLDELLSEKCANLDRGGILSFLQERLEIKPLDLDKVCLPEFHGVGMDSFMDFREIPRKPRKALSDIQNLEKRTSGKTPVKHREVVESPILSLTSPAPPKSPFASMSLLKKRMLQSDLRSDPFSYLDLSPDSNSASVELVVKSDHQAERMEFEISGELKSPINAIGETRVDDVGSQEMITEESITPREKSTDNSGRLLAVIDVLSSGSVGEKYTKRSRNVDESAVEYNDSRINTDAGVETNGPDEMEEEIALNTKADILENKHSEMEDNVGDMLQKVGSSADFNLGGSSRPDAELLPDGQHEMGNTLSQTNVEDTAQDAQQDGNIGQPATENLDNNQTRLDESLPSTVEPHAVGVSADASDEFPENVKEPSRVPLNEQTPAKRPPRGKRKAVSHRKSLAGCGTSWEDGVRRSKRIRMRPLEYWKGERFLYGRIHESSSSLGVKVIGVKYVSPAKEVGGKSSIKVKSFVSDEFKELVDIAALH